MTDNGNSKSNRAQFFVQLAVWLIPIIFVAGGAWVMLNANREAIADTTERVDRADQKAEKAQTKTEQCEARISNVEATAKDLLQEQKRQGENISAICQATSARCR
jgi:F0F1-type ATP synthase membrane subunit b/b'